MAGPIYLLAMGKMSEAWYQLSKEEQEKLFAKTEEAFEQVGGKRILACQSTWADEGVQWWVVEEYPDIEAVQKVAQRNEDLDWYRYVDSKTLLGTKLKMA